MEFKGKGGDNEVKQAPPAPEPEEDDEIILDPGSFSIKGDAVTEGGLITFTVTRSGDPGAGPTSVKITLNGNTANSGDFAVTEQVLNFAAGETKAILTVATTQDSWLEADEFFTATLTNATGGANVASGLATATIYNDESVPTFSIASSANTEGDVITFTVTRDGDSQAEQTVTFATDAFGTAASNEFVANSGTLTFSQGSYSETFTVVTGQDTLFENNETFAVSLGTVNFGGIAAGMATGTILNDEAIPSFSISGGGSVTEDGLVTFTVTRNGDSQANQTVVYGTNTGSAGSGDFASDTSGTLTFTQGQYSQTFTVDTTQDTLYENNESFTASLANASLGGGFTAATASATILNDEAVPSFSISNSNSAEEGNAVTFTVTRNGDSQAAQTVAYNASISGNASSNDFDSSASGTLTFTQGQYSQTFTVNTTEDTLYETDQSFIATLSNNSLGGGWITSTGTGTILNDEAPPSFSIGGGSVSEDGLVIFTVTRNGDSQDYQFVSYDTNTDSAGSGDFASNSGTLTFTQGQYSQTFTVDTTQDTLYENNETFIATLSKATLNGSIVTGTATGTIVNDEQVPSFSLSGGGSITEGNVVTFTVSRTGDSQANQTVVYGTNTGSAGSGDFASGTSGTLTFTQGQYSQTFTVGTTQDTLYESNETFTATLANASLGGGFVSTTVSATILNDEAVPSFSISNSNSAEEGNAVTFTVTRNGDSQAQQTVAYNAGISGNASSNDFDSSASGTLTFTQGQYSQTFTVNTTEDTLY
ncbi:MAG: hypothetical protein G8345_18480, partial [Magnetococcales bacterium]|nr:hypothetical protein [Magnetococcales bacterium]